MAPRGGFCVLAGVLSLCGLGCSADHRSEGSDGSAPEAVAPDAGRVAADAASTSEFDATLADTGSPALDSSARPDAHVSMPDAGPPDDDGGRMREIVGVIRTGNDQLVDAFAVSGGVVVIETRAVLLVGYDASVVHEIDWPREITTAAFDGELLAVADRAVLTALTPELVEVSSLFLTEECADSVIVEGARFVCGPANDWDRIFYTYDIAAGQLLAMSDPNTYRGIPMQRVPGTNRFVTITVSSSPSDLFLYEVDQTDAVVFINESPYHGDFPMTDVFAFDGTPPEHLVTHQGRMLDLTHDDCNADQNSFDSGCFRQEGNLGTLHGDTTFAAMSNDASGLIYALIDGHRDRYDDPFCASGCAVQQIDVATRTVSSEAMFGHSAAEIVVFRHHADAGSVLFGYHTSGSSWDGFSDYEIRLVGY